MLTELETKPDPQGVTLDRNNILESDRILNFIEDKDIIVKEIEYGFASVYIGDFYGLLRRLDVPDRLLNATLIMNGLSSSTMYDGNFVRIELIDPAMVDRIDAILYST